VLKSTDCLRAAPASRTGRALSSSWRRPALPPRDGVVRTAQATAKTEPPDDFGVYVHWPFCLSKCPYCDFNSHVRHATIDEPRFVRAFAAEIAATAERVGGRVVSTIYSGGGTPSLMQPPTFCAILDAL